MRFLIPAFVLETVNSSKNPPIAIMTAITPAANNSPIRIEEIIATETRTSAFMSNSVQRPIIASLKIGMPQNNMAIQIKSNLNMSVPIKLRTTEIMEMNMNKTSFI